jgi:potassium efflux system protein
MRSLSRRWWFGCAVAAVAAVGAVSANARASEAVDGAAAVPHEVSQPPEAPRGLVTVAEIERRRAELDEVPGLSPEVRAEITEQYTKAIEKLETAAQYTAQMQSLEAEASRVPEEITRLERHAGSRTDGHGDAPEIPDEPELLRAAHRDTEAAANEARKRLAAVTAEIERRTVRSRELPELLRDVRSRLDSIAESLAASPAAGEPPELVEARRLRLVCARQHRLAELEFLEREGPIYAATGRVLALERDQAEQAAAESGRRAAVLARAVADREQRDAETRAEEARQAAIMAHPAVREAAGVNTSLAEKHALLVEAGKETRLELEKVEALRDQLGPQYAETRKRAEEARFSPSIGLLLRSQQNELPDTLAYRRRAADRAERQAAVNLELLEWETQRRRLGSTDELVADHLDTVRGDLGFAEQLAIRDELEAVLRGRLSLYSDLISGARSHLGWLAALQSAEDGLVRAVEEQRAFIAEHVLWVPSTAPLSAAVLSLATHVVTELGNPVAWDRVGRALLADARDHPIVALAMLAVGWLIAIRRRLAARLAGLASDAQRSSVTGFRPTLEAIAVSFVLALPGPAIMAFCGWRLMAIGTAGTSAMALGSGLMASAGGFLAVNLGSAVCLPKGLGPAHFGWDKAAAAAIRRAMAVTRWTCLPAGIVVMFTEASGDDLLVGTVGRLALVAECLSLTGITWSLVRRSGPVQIVLANRHRGAWAHLAISLATGLLVILPMAFAGLSLAGYHDTAMRLSARLFATWGLIGVSGGLGALVLRWLTLVHRRLTLERARARRAEMAARHEHAGAEVPLPDDRSLELRLVDIEDQSRRLVTLAVAAASLGCLAFIWHDILPAVAYLRHVTLWHGGLVAGGDPGEFVRITLVDALLAGIGVAVTVLACRNLPGLLDLAVFQRLPLDAGARYAATAVTQYAVAVAGAMLCFRQIGIGWQSVQWLVAAMTVGLGFGLQEIFANFVSGIIILFERPIRVGDVVTIGDVTGTVTRIRIRATTICDWDHKELIVPNREFVTGKLVNWTLTNPTLRVVIRVGIAYGSDTRLASTLLGEVALAQPLVLADPPPTVVFTQFGENSLDFELRVFTTGVVNTRIVRHELHVAIDDAFRANGIAIAFPQRELHVKGLPAHWHEPTGDFQPVEIELTARADGRRVA